MALATIPTAGAQPGAPAFNVNDRSTWGANAPAQPSEATNVYVPNYRWGNGGKNDPIFQEARYQNQQSGAAPWLSNAQFEAQRRNNFYYGGSPNGAQNFNAQVGGLAQQLGANYGESYDTAGYWEGQNQAMRDAGGQLGAAFGQRANAAGNLGAQAAQRAPGQFLDQQSIANSSMDRATQLNAISGLNGFIANGPGPSAAQAQLNNATDANMQNALALARSGRGMGGSAAGLRQAIGQNAVTQQQAANQSAALRAQEAQAWQQNQLNAYGQIGGLAANARQGDIAAGQYVTGAQQANRNAADQASLGYYGLQNQFGAQQLGALGAQQQANAQGLQASQFGLSAQQANAQTQMAALGMQNGVNQNQLAANQAYEQNLQNYYLNKAPPQNNGTDYTPYIQAAAAIAAAAL